MNSETNNASLLILNLVRENPEACIALLSLILSIIALIYSISFNRNFAKQEYIKKQVSVVASLTDYLNRAHIKISITDFHENGHNSTDMEITIFEFSKIPKTGIYQKLKYLSILFDGSCNQLLDIKKYINDPFLPKTIADALELLYAHNNTNIERAGLAGKEAIVITTSVFDASHFERPVLKPHSIVKECNGFAYLSWQNLVQITTDLESTIYIFLKKYNVKEINIRRAHLTT